MKYMEPTEPQVLDNFIVLEGLDGAGTTTQLKLIDRKLDTLAIPHTCTSEPTDGFIGLVLRSILEKRIKAQNKTVALLYAADRNEHLWEPERGMAARLKKGDLVICDRYLFSSLAYQSLFCGFEYVLSLNREFPLPRHLVFIDTPAELSQQRLKERRERELFDDTEIQPQLLAGYRRTFSLYSQTEMRIHRLDGSRPPEEVFKEFWRIVQTLPMVK